MLKYIILSGLFAVSTSVVLADEIATIRPMMNASGTYGTDSSGKIILSPSAEKFLSQMKIDKSLKAESYVYTYAPSTEMKMVDVAFKSELPSGEVLTSFASGSKDQTPSKTTFQFKDGKVVGLLECNGPNCAAVSSELCTSLDEHITQLSNESIKSMQEKVFQKLNEANEAKFKEAFSYSENFVIDPYSASRPDQDRYHLDKLCKRFKVNLDVSSEAPPKQSSGSTGR